MIKEQNKRKMSEKNTIDSASKNPTIEVIEEDREAELTDEPRQLEPQNQSQRDGAANDYDDAHEQSELQALRLLSRNIVDMGQRYGEMETRITERLNSLEHQSNTLQDRVQKLNER